MEGKSKSPKMGVIKVQKVKEKEQLEKVQLRNKQRRNFTELRNVFRLKRLTKQQAEFKKKNKSEPILVKFPNPMDAEEIL